MMVMLHKIAYKINSSILGVFRYPTFKNSYIPNAISISHFNFNSYNHSFLIYSYLIPYKQSDRINS